MSSSKFVFFGPIGKTKLPPWPLIGWDIFDFSSETAERNSTKLDRKQDLNVLYQVCVFQADRKTKWPPLPLIGWDIFNFSTAERNSMNLTGSKMVEDVEILLPVKFRWIPFSGFSGEVENVSANQRPGRQSCFSDRPEKHKLGRGCWDLASCQVSLNSIQRFQRRSQKCLSQSEARVAILFFWSAQKHKLLNVFYKVCVFRADRKNKMAALASDWLRHFRLLHWNRLTEFNKTWQEARSQRPLPSLCFWADQKNKMATLASDWLRHFWLLLWNRWMEFNETWQEARSQHPLPSLCFSGRSEKQDCRPGLWLAETFSTSPLKPLNGIQRNLTGSKISTSSTKFVFIGPISQQKCSSWLIPQKGGRLFSGARYVALWASCLF